MCFGVVRRLEGAAASTGEAGGDEGRRNSGGVPGAAPTHRLGIRTTRTLTSQDLLSAAPFQPTLQGLNIDGASLRSSSSCSRHGPANGDTRNVHGVFFLRLTEIMSKTD